MASKRRKFKKFSIALPPSEVAKLNFYASSHGMGSSMALRTLVRQQLSDIDISADHQTDSHQLGLFDTLQIDIFNNAKVCK